MSDSTSPSPSLPVTKLTLFSHGVANLEHCTQVKDDTTLHLSFPERHMNDILKSLTVVDKNDGKIASISYDAPSDRRPLSKETLRLDPESPLRSLLESAQGASITLRLRHDEARGTLLGLQWLPSSDSSGARSVSLLRQPPTSSADSDLDPSNKTLNIVLLRDGARLSCHDVTHLVSIEFHDRQLQRLLQRRVQSCMSTLRSKNNKSVTISAKGNGKRTILVNYAVESPVPKLTYRFLLSSARSEGNAAKEDGVLVQGWAIVDNPSDEDLTDIDIAIVSGLPISFRHDLYGSRYVDRPEEEVPTATGPGYSKPSEATFGQAGVRKKKLTLAKRTFSRSRDRGRGGGHASNFSRQGELTSSEEEEEMAEEEEEISFDLFDDGMSPAQSGPISLFGGDHLNQETLLSSAPPPAETSEVGDLFEYNIPVKVTIKAQESALVPLIMQQCEGGRVDIYSHTVRPNNTLSAVRIKNTTDATFEGGPVSVFEKSRLVGEGMMPACRPSSEQFLPYSVDLDCIAELKTAEQDSKIISTVAVGHSFKITRYRESVKSYTFNNNKPDDIDLYVLHDLEPLFKVQSVVLRVTRSDEAQASSSMGVGSETDLKALDEIDGIVRYRFTVSSGRTATLVVRATKQISSSYKIRKYCTTKGIIELTKDGALSQATVSKMKEVMQMAAKSQSAENEISVLESEVRSWEMSQKRYRQNLQSLSGLQDSQRFRDDPLIEKFLKSLSRSEERIEKLEQQIRSTDERRAKWEGEVGKMIRAFGSGELKET